MKSLAALITLTLLATGHPQQIPLALETDTELSSAGDFDGNGARLRDHRSGDGSSACWRRRRIGTFATGTPRPTGVAGATALGTGRLHAAARDSFAVTAPAWNRVQLVDPAAPQPLAAAQGGLGPVALAVLDLPGAANDPALDDLMVASGADSPPEPDQISLLRVSAGAATAFEGMTAAGAPLSHGRRVRLKSGGASHRRVHCGGAGLVRVPRLRERRRRRHRGAARRGGLLMLGADYAFGFFDNTTPLAQFLFYLRGDTLLELRLVSEPAPEQFEMSDRAVFDLGAPIHLVSTVEHTGGTWLLILFDGGAYAELFDFDAQGAPVSRQVFTPPPGEAFTSAAGLGGDFLLTAGSGGQTAGWRRYNLGGAVHVLASSGTGALLTRSPPSQPFSSLKEASPSSPEARMTRMLKAGDWTSAVAYAGTTSAPPRCASAAR